MKTFKDLQFKAHDWLPGVYQARIDLPNGYAISVVYGKYITTNKQYPYEIAAINPQGGFSELEPFKGTVIPGLNKKQVTEHMAIIQNYQQ